VRQVVGDQKAAYVRVARRGVYHFDGMRATALAAPHGLSFVDATSIALGADHALWVAGPGWVCVRRNGKWQQVRIPADVSGAWRVIVADGAGAFVGSADGAVLALNRGAEFRASLGEGLPAPAVASLRPDGSGSAWFVSGGRVISANAADQRIAVENSPLDAEAVDFSPSGSLVVASRWTVSRKGENGWTDMTPDVGETDPAFASIFVDGRDMVWVGARSGALYRFDGEIWVRYARPLAVGSSLRDARAFPADDWALLGSSPMRNVAGSWSSFGGWDSSRVIVDVAVGPAGEWIAATKELVFRYDAARDRWQPFSAGAKQDSRATWPAPGAITSITFDAKGRLFVGTTDGFGCYADGKTRWWDVRDGIGGERVSDLAADGTTLWVGYGEDGLSAIPLANLR
jgi:ligand-binding sensor domain-containing protein